MGSGKAGGGGEGRDFAKLQPMARITDAKKLSIWAKLKRLALTDVGALVLTFVVCTAISAKVFRWE